VATAEADLLSYLRAHLRGKVRLYPTEVVPPGTLPLDLNEGPYGPTPSARAAIDAAIGELNRYPNASGDPLKEALAAHHGVDPSMILLGAGSNSLGSLLIRTTCDPGDVVAYSWPGFPSYSMAASRMNVQSLPVPLLDGGDDDLEALAAAAPRARMVVLATPANPTGRWVAEGMREFVEAASRHALVVVDEAYVDYAPPVPTGLDLVKEGAPIVSLRTFSKIWGLAGLRIGYAVMPATLAAHARSVQDTFEVSTLAQVAALASLQDTGEIARRAAENARVRSALEAHLADRGVEYYPSAANFVCCRPADDAVAFSARMTAAGALVRPLAVFGDPERVRIGLPAEPDLPRLLGAVDAALAGTG
jgi:histidinol-phosphate aminotransferase